MICYKAFLNVNSKCHSISTLTGLHFICNTDINCRLYYVWLIECCGIAVSWEKCNKACVYSTARENQSDCSTARLIFNYAASILCIWISSQVSSRFFENACYKESFAFGSYSSMVPLEVICTKQCRLEGNIWINCICPV